MMPRICNMIPMPVCSARQVRRCPAVSPSRTAQRAVTAVILGGMFIGITTLGATGCASKREVSVADGDSSLRSESPGKRELLTINSIYVAPVTTAREVIIDSARVKRFGELLTSAFSAESGIDVVSDSVVSNSGARAGTKGAARPAADATLHAEITRFAEGKGSALGTTQAALLGVNYSLVRNSDNREIWTSSFYSTEQPNSYDLIEVTKRLGREKDDGIATTSKLANQAAHEAARDFSARRVAQFSR